MSCAPIFRRLKKKEEKSNEANNNFDITPRAKNRENQKSCYR